LFLDDISVDLHPQVLRAHGAIRAAGAKPRLSRAAVRSDVRTRENKDLELFRRWTSRTRRGLRPLGECAKMSATSVRSKHMARFMLLQNYGGVPDMVPMTEWTPEAINAHIAFQVMLNKELTAKGELVDAQGLSGPELAKFVVSDGAGAPVVTDGPFPESKELLAGYRIVDVDSEARAIEIAAQASAAPGRNGTPIQQAIEVREIMGTPRTDM
jgi:hypothetical protein